MIKSVAPKKISPKIITTFDKIRTIFWQDNHILKIHTQGDG